MDQTQWDLLDDYLCSQLVAPDDALDAALRLSAEAGLPAINVAPNQGKFLQLLARLRGAKRILELGTLGGYSTIWLARALPSGGRIERMGRIFDHACLITGLAAALGRNARLYETKMPSIGAL